MVTSEDGPDDDLLGVRGKLPYGPRWEPLGQKINDAARKYARGRLAAADTLLEEVHRATLVDDVDGAGLDARARALANRASIAQDRGDLAASLRFAEDCLAACAGAESLIGDRRGTADVRVAILVNRAQTLQLVGRAADALRDLDGALAAGGASAGNPPLLSFHLHNTRGCTLTLLERYAEAFTDVRRALEIALESEPRLAGHAYANLAMLARRTGDHAGAEENLRLARELHGLAGDTAAHALTGENLARAALDTGRLADAERGFGQAQQVYERAGLVLQVADCRIGRAAVALRRGRPFAARRLLAGAAADLTAAGAVPNLIECHLLRGDIAAGSLRFAAAETAYLEARELCIRSGARHEAARVDVRRAIALFVSTRITFGRRARANGLTAALTLALPAALATDAIRHHFDPGPTRERWARAVSAPALTLAFALVAALGRTRLAFELVEYASATVDLRSTTAAVAASGRSLAEHTRTAITEVALGAARFDLPAAAASGDTAAADPGAQFPPAGLALPPRLRMTPSDESALDSWIDAAEEQYGFPVRSSEVIQAW